MAYFPCNLHVVPLDLQRPFPHDSTLRFPLSMRFPFISLSFCSTPFPKRFPFLFVLISLHCHLHQFLVAFIVLPSKTGHDSPVRVESRMMLTTSLEAALAH